jgi:hypothetical protein
MNGRREWTLVLAGVAAGAAAAIGLGTAFALPSALNRAAAAMTELSQALKEGQGQPAPAISSLSRAAEPVAVPVAVPVPAARGSNNTLPVQADDEEDEVSGERRECVCVCDGKT